MCFVYDYEPALFPETEHRKCRKKTRCDICCEPILAGQQYEYNSMLFDGKFSKFRACNLCVQNRIRIVKYELLEGCSVDEA